MSSEETEFKSIEEVRSAFYPRGAGMLGLEKEEILRFPANMGNESSQTEEIVPKRHKNHDDKRKPL